VSPAEEEEDPVYSPINFMLQVNRGLLRLAEVEDVATQDWLLLFTHKIIIINPSYTPLAAVVADIVIPVAALAGAAEDSTT